MILGANKGGVKWGCGEKPCSLLVVILRINILKIYIKSSPLSFFLSLILLRIVVSSTQILMDQKN